MRTKPIYSYTFCKDAPLKEQRHSHTMKGKSKAPTRFSKPPRSMPKQSAGMTKEVSYGSHKAYENVLENTRKEIGYV